MYNGAPVWSKPSTHCYLTPDYRASPKTTTNVFTSPGAFVVMEVGLPIARPRITYAFPALTNVCPHTSNSCPKSLGNEKPGTARHWLVWQCCAMKKKVSVSCALREAVCGDWERPVPLGPRARPP
jgi:hypothetical protein